MKALLVRPLAVSPWALAMFVCGAACWVGAAFGEGSVSIAVLHLSLLVLSAGLVMLGRDSAFCSVFAVALLARTLAALVFWYAAPDDMRRLFLGTNDDAFRFWEASSLDWDTALLTVEDPFFPALNVLVHQISAWLSAPHYLAAIQPVVFAGALFAAVAGALIALVFGRQAGLLTGLLLALHPTAVAMSTGLMRDSIIALAGAALLWAAATLRERQRWSGRLLPVLVLCTATAALLGLRTLSWVGFTGTAVLLLFSAHVGRPARGRWVLVAAVAAAAMAALWLRYDGLDGIFLHAIASRLGEGMGGQEMDQYGLSARVADVSPWLFTLLAPLAWVQPFPFYAWAPPGWWFDATPAWADVFLGLGGLLNQVLFGFYLAAVGYWCARRDRAGLLLCVAMPLLVGALALVALGQIRMVMAHAYPFFLAGAALMWCRMQPAQRARVTLVWLIGLSGVYGTYWGLRDSMPFLMLGGAGIAAIAVYIMLACGWRLAINPVARAALHSDPASNPVRGGSLV